MLKKSRPPVPTFSDMGDLRVESQRTILTPVAQSGQDLVQLAGNVSSQYGAPESQRAEYNARFDAQHDHLVSQSETVSTASGGAIPAPVVSRVSAIPPMDGDELMWKGIESGAKCAVRRLKKGQEAEGDKHVMNVWRKERKRRQKQTKSNETRDNPGTAESRELEIGTVESRSWDMPFKNAWDRPALGTCPLACLGQARSWGRPFKMLGTGLFFAVAFYLLCLLFLSSLVVADAL